MIQGNIFRKYYKTILTFIMLIFISFSNVDGSLEINVVSQIPILSYHNVQTNPKKPSAYFISSAVFEKQIKYLKEKGYHSVLPDDIYNHYNKGNSLPEKPIMISFDDTRKEHFHIVAPILEKYGFKGTFFIMTVVIGKKKYMNAAEIKMLSERGHCIGHHTWDHHDIRKLTFKDWETQIDKPKRKLEEIIGKEVQYLAYPFGLCNEYAVKGLKKRNFKGAFQLSGKQLKSDQIFTIRRLIVPGTWDGQQLMKEITYTFK